MQSRLAVVLWAVLASMAAGMASCTHRRGWRPQSGGKPYEVLVVGDRHGIVDSVLSQGAAGLPQREPDFDVSAIATDSLDATLRLARAIVMVDIDSTLYTATRLHYEKDLYAAPQMVVRLCAPSDEALRGDMPRHAATLRALLHRAETNAAIARLKHKRNAQAEQTVAQQLGVSLWIPADMTATMVRPGFVWLSNNAPTGMQSIVVYKSAQAHSATTYTALRDSALGKHIKGETDGMHMATVAASVTGQKVAQDNRCIAIWRGLWEMQGDAMGGPFVSHTVDGITAEAFVFSPATKKRNLMRQLEAALYTLKRQHNEQ